MIGWDAILSFGFGGLFQMLVLMVMFYYILLFFRGTRGVHILIGLALLTIFLNISTHFFHLTELNWLFRRLMLGLSLAILVIFQPEIRRALAELGRQPAFSGSAEDRSTVNSVVEAILMLAEHRIGALIAVEREIGMRAVQETGVKLDARVVPELLASIFFPHTPLHDGGVIIRGNRILAAGCVFPLSQQTELHKQLGTRHRAAIGMSEESDAVLIVVSEETGTISVCYRGRLSRGMDEARLRRFLSALLLKGRSGMSAWRRAREQLDLTPEGIAKSEQLAGSEQSGGG
ncbi:MAG: TIGR00159 family protein [Lentisphaerae bacterium RIFOXYC12_FULL_60_16]|nr:MAG: TIGR00159 family protein [Lentisphaerae bacterium RIFOXYC12_FULL_60_16]OGV72586.1 MAG: TIGR00159 family protein [Lentisphaerae bacterium RIFOXYA12_FULL_60_10]OGV77292.1 MAG: TIGR00159 family protein [Lentisphaerae bacterium RIFOXYB12_FULL_60_10]